MTAVADEVMELALDEAMGIYHSLRASGRSKDVAQEVAASVAREYLESRSLPVPACPVWCTAPAPHNWHADVAHVDDAGRNVYSREHDGPRFGYFQCFAYEYSDAEGVLKFGVTLEPGRDVDTDFTSASDLNAIARDARRAADWLSKS